MTSQEQINELVDRLDWDSEFATPWRRIRSRRFEARALTTSPWQPSTSEIGSPSLSTGSIATTNSGGPSSETR